MRLRASAPDKSDVATPTQAAKLEHAAPVEAAPATTAASAPSAVTSTSGAVSSAAPAPSGPVTVTIHAKPKGAIILEHAHRLGVNKVEVTVQPGQKRSFVALMDNYAPKRFSVDGSVDTVEIQLSRMHSRSGAAAPSTSNAVKAP